MKKIFQAFVWMLPIFAYGQNKSSFELIGKNVKDLQKVYLMHYSFDDDVIITDSAEVKDGTFTIKRDFQGAAYAGVCLRDKLTKPTISKGEFWFYLSPGLNVIDFNDKPKLVDGGKEAKTYINMLSKIDAHRATLSSPAYQEKLNKIKELNDQSAKLKIELEKEYKSIGTVNAEEKLAFIRNNPNYGLSLIFLEGVVRAKQPASLTLPLLEAMPKSFQDSPRGKKLRGLIVGQEYVVGSKAPEVIQPGVDGKLIKLSDFKGKYVLLDFWASWCVPCRKESPHLVKAYENFKGKNFEIFAVSLDTDKAKWLEAIKEDKMTWIHGSDLIGSKNSAAVTYAVRGIPDNVLIDPNGVIIARELRGEALAKFLEEKLK